MKKWLIGVFVVATVILICCQLFIPRDITINESAIARANVNGVYRYLSTDSNWTAWWPEKQNTQKDSISRLIIDGYAFTRTKLGYNSFGFDITNNGPAMTSALLLSPAGMDSMRIYWSVSSSAESNNLFSKINHYFSTRSVRSGLKEVVGSLVNHVSETRNVYGLDIRKEKFKMEFLVSKRRVFDSIPKNGEIYHLIDEIRREIKERKAVEDGQPMFHIEPLENNKYELLAGVPVRDAFEAQAPFTTLKLLKGGNTLVTEVKGGQASADKAARILKVYADDHKDLNVALPFNTLVTDRLAIKDSNQWVTRLNYPCL